MKNFFLDIKRKFKKEKMKETYDLIKILEAGRISLSKKKNQNSMISKKFIKGAEPFLKI